MVKSPWYDDNGMKKGAWSEDEDQRLKAYVSRYGHWNWRQLPKFAGLRRCGKSCRLRWLNYLRPGVKHGNYSKEEEDLIVELHKKHGNKWSIIASHLPGRTDNEIKNYWNTNLNRQGKNKIAAPQSKGSDQLNGSSGDKANHKAHDLEPTTQENATFDHCYSLEQSSVESAYQYRQWVTSLEQSSVESLRQDIACSSEMVEDPIMMDGDFWTQPFLEDKYLFMTNDNDDVALSFLDEEGLLFPYAS